MTTLRYLLILAFCFSGELSAAIYKVDFAISLDKHTFNMGKTTDMLNIPVTGTATVLYNSAETFQDGSVLRNWTSQFKNIRLLNESPNRHLEQALIQTQTSTGLNTHYGAQTETQGLDLGFQGENLTSRGLGYESFFLSALLDNYHFSAKVTELLEFEFWEGSARVTAYSAVPVPAAVYLFISGLLTLGLRKKRKA